MNILDIERQFAAFASEHGLFGLQPVADGKLRRHDDPDARRGNKLFWSVLHADVAPVGILGHWRHGWTRVWHLGRHEPMTAEQQRITDERIEAIQRQRRAEREFSHREAANRALSRWQLSEPADPEHPYLVAKRIPPLNMRQDQGALLVPLFAPEDGRIANIQRIYPDGSKRFMSGARVTGCYWPISELGSRIFICEGPATAVSLWEMTGDAVAAAMNAGNLIHVAQHFQHKYPHAEIIIGADDDRKTEGNPGQTIARKAAAKLGIKVASPIWPTEAPDHLSDFNDLATWGAKNHEC